MRRVRPGIDVVVVSYRTPDDLDGFADSFRGLRDLVDRSLTVVNVEPRAEDKLAGERAVAGQRFPAVHLAMDSNVGYSGACNHAAALGAREVVAFFNADTVLTDRVLDDCHRALLENPTWGVLGPRQVNDRGQLTHGGIFGTGEAPRFRGWKDRDDPRYGDIRDDAVTVAGSAYFVRRALWDELTACPLYQQVYPGAAGAFLPTPHYYEETWCSYHARAHGYRCVYFGPARMIHRWHQASPVGGWADRQLPASQAMFRSACAAHGIGCD